MRLVLPLLLLALVALPLGACGENDSDTPTLRFSAIPGEKATKLKEKFGRFGEYLSKELGVPVEYVAASDYPASVSMFANGDIQLAWFGGLTGVQARAKVDGSHAIAQGAEDPQYYSYFIANKSTGIEPSDDFPMELAGKQFTFGSASSTSGRLMPEHFIRKFTGKSPEEFFGHPNVYSNAHDKTAKNVESGAADAGALSYKTYDKMKANGEIDPEVCRVIWKTPFYADYNFTAHPALEEMFGAGFTAKLKTAILKYSERDVLDNGFQRSKFISAEDEDFAAIKELAEQLELLN